MEPYVRFEDVCKYYQTGETRIAAADHVNFEINKGEFCIIVGPSGAGKTTVLNMLGGMDTCDEGRIILDGRVVSDFSQKELTAYRRYDVGFVFQFYNLVQNLTAVENVELANEICRNPMDAVQVLRDVGLGHRLKNFPAQLSGGEQQRVAIARAIAHRPKIIFADEPTAELDTAMGLYVMKAFKDLIATEGITIVMTTHDPNMMEIADRVYTLQDGVVIDER